MELCAIGRAYSDYSGRMGTTCSKLRSVEANHAGGEDERRLGKH